MSEKLTRCPHCWSALPEAVGEICPHCLISVVPKARRRDRQAATTAPATIEPVAETPPSQERASEPYVPYQPYATPQSSPQQPQPGGSGVVVAERAPNEFSGQTLPPGMFPPAPAHPQARRTSPGKRMLGIAAGVIGALIGTALVGGMLGTKTDNGQKRIDAYLSGEGAKEFFASDAQFRATFPSIPERTVKSVNAGGAQINVVFYMSGVGDDGGFAVSEFDVPAGVPFDLNMGVNGAAAAVGGHIESAVPASFGGYPAMEFLVSGAEGHNLYVRGLAIKAPSRVYILQVVDSVNPPPGYEKFKASFRIGAQ